MQSPLQAGERQTLRRASSTMSLPEGGRLLTL